jgi:hypothetical protein
MLIRVCLYMWGTKKWEKNREGAHYYPLYTLVLQSSTMYFMSSCREFSYSSFFMLVGFLHYKNLTCIFQWWASSNARGCEQASWMHTHLVALGELPYTYSSGASVAWQSLLLASISIVRLLHFLAISCIGVRLSQKNLLIKIPIIILFAIQSAKIKACDLSIERSAE